eukprot:COSAG06_NODE_20906_length_777_cov_0.796460_1_plen_115_part_10
MYAGQIGAKLELPQDLATHSSATVLHMSPLMMVTKRCMRVAFFANIVASTKTPIDEPWWEWGGVGGMRESVEASILRELERGGPWRGAGTLYLSRFLTNTIPIQVSGIITDTLQV